MGDGYGMRGAAAGRLMKGKKGAPPPEEDLGLPPEDGMAQGGGAPDLAALLGGAGGGPPPGGPEGGAPPPMEGGPMPEEAAPGQAPDLDTALAGVEGALDAMPPEAAEEIRTHLNAIRDIAAKGGAQMQPQEAPPGAAPGGTPEPVVASPGEKEIGG